MSSDENENNVKLLQCCDKKDKQIGKPSRNELTLQTTEFHLSKGTKKPAVLKDLVRILGKTASHAEIGKKLQVAQKSIGTLKKPLDKTQIAKATRSVGFEEIKKKLSRWDAIVTKNRASDHLVYPLKRPINKLQNTGAFLSKFQMKSDLEKDLEALEPEKIQDKKNTSGDTGEFELTLAEMLEQRKEIARLRARQAYQAAKGKRQNKIKSKKFHRIEKRNKMKQQLKDFEQLQKTNPEEALKQLEAIEKARAVERVTLRHKNTGQWAKSKLVRAKYDKETRQQLAEQLAVSRDLTQKLNKIDEESEDDETGEMHIGDTSNPWINLKDSGATQEEIDFVSGYRKYWDDKNKTTAGESTSEKSVLMDEMSVSLQEVHPINETKNNSQDEHKILPSKEFGINKFNGSVEFKVKCKTNELKTPLSTSEWVVEEIIEVINKHSLEKTYHFEDDATENINNVEVEVAKRIKTLKRALADTPKLKKINENSIDEEPLSLEFKLRKNKPILDERLNETSGNIREDDEKPWFSRVKQYVNKNSTNGDLTDIDPNKFVNIKPKNLPTALPDELDGDFLDNEDDSNTKVMNIQEAFEEDDIVAEFRQEKTDEINKNKAKDIDLTLPGWGSWGGKNIKISKRKRKRFIVKMPEPERRRDENKGDIIIREHKNAKLSSHKVSEVPFPFTSIKAFEASVRAPIGNTFIPETAFKKLIKPTVITKLGSVIEPMDEDQLINYKNKNNIHKREQFIKIN